MLFDTLPVTDLRHGTLLPHPWQPYHVEGWISSVMKMALKSVFASCLARVAGQIGPPAEKTQNHQTRCQASLSGNGKEMASMLGRRALTLQFMVM